MAINKWLAGTGLYLAIVLVLYGQKDVQRISVIQRGAGQGGGRYRHGGRSAGQDVGPYRSSFHDPKWGTRTFKMGR